MKRLLLILILTLSFQSWTIADEITDFEIEGISVGDSALSFFNKNEIKNNTWDYYKDKKFTPVQMTGLYFFETYQGVDFDYKTEDKNYTIYSLSGILKYNDKNIKDCYKKMDEIDEELQSVLEDFKKEDKATWKHAVDPTGESTFTDIYYESEEGNVTITCYNFSEKQEKKGSGDYLSIMIALNEWVLFMRNNPYN